MQKSKQDNENLYRSTLEDIQNADTVSHFNAMPINIEEGKSCNIRGESFESASKNDFSSNNQENLSVSDQISDRLNCAFIKYSSGQSELSDLPDDLINKGLIHNGSQSEFKSQKIKKDDQNIYQSDFKLKPKLKRNCLISGDVNNSLTYFQYETISSRLIQNTTSSFTILTPQEVLNDQQYNFVNVRSTLLKLQLVDQQKYEKRKMIGSGEALFQFRVNKIHPYYISNRVAHFHQIIPQYRKNYLFREDGTKNLRFYEVDLENFSLELGDEFLKIINEMSDIQIDHLNYQQIVQLLKWAIKYNLKFPRYVLYSYMIPQMEILDAIYFFNFSMIEQKHYQKNFNQALKAYISLFIGQNLELFIQEFNNNSQKHLISIENFHPLFYYSLIYFEKEIRDKIIQFLMQQFYKLQENLLLQQLSKEFNGTFAYFGYIPHNSLLNSNQNLSLKADIQQNQHLILNNIHQSQQKNISFKNLIFNETECYLDLDQIGINGIIITNCFYTTSNSWRLILINDQHSNLSIFIHNKGQINPEKDSQYFDNISESFNQKVMNVQSPFVFLHAEIVIDNTISKFSHPFCKNQHDTFGICNIVQISQQSSLIIKLVEIPFISQILSICLQNLDVQTLNPQFQFALLNSDQFYIKYEQELLLYIQKIWNYITKEEKKLYLSTLRINLISQQDLYTENNELNDILLMLQTKQEYNKHPRINQKDKFNYKRIKPQSMTKNQWWDDIQLL